VKITSTGLILFSFLGSVQSVAQSSYNSIKINTMQNINTVPWSKDVMENFISINNCSIRYLTAGKGEPLLLIHTIRTQSDLFQKAIPTLAKHFSVYAIDLPGHGGSEIPKLALNELYFRDCVIKFMNELQLQNVTIVGESIGAVLALTIASTDTSGNQVKEVFAFNPYDYDRKSGIRRSSKTARNVFNAVRIPIINLLVSNMETDNILRKIMEGGLTHKDSLPTDLLKTIGSTRKHKGFARGFRSLVRNNASWIDARGLYSNIKIPVALIYSSNDWSTREERNENQKLIPGNISHTLEDTGHWSSIDNPEGFLKFILKND
jgi:pimeloyl-ACP methyl ester carboxylesterase